MIVIDSAALSRLARFVRKEALALGASGNYSIYHEACAAALGFGDVNKATAFLRQRAIVVGLPSAFYLQAPAPSPETAALHLARLLVSAGIKSTMPLGERAERVVTLATSIGVGPEVLLATRVSKATYGALAGSRHVAVSNEFDQNALFDSRIESLTKWVAESSRDWDVSIGEWGAWRAGSDMPLPDEVRRILKELEARRTDLRRWDYGSRVIGDIRLHMDVMAKALSTRVGMRVSLPPAVGLEQWLAVWTSAMQSEMGQPASSSDAENSIATAALATLASEHPRTMPFGRWSLVDAMLVSECIRLEDELERAPVCHVGAKLTVYTATLLSDATIVKFDAVPFLRIASLENLQALSACDWTNRMDGGKENPMDLVVSFITNLPERDDVRQVVRVMHGVKDCTVSIDTRQAMIWLSDNRPDIYPAIYAARWRSSEESYDRENNPAPKANVQALVVSTKSPNAYELSGLEVAHVCHVLIEQSMVILGSARSRIDSGNEKASAETRLSIKNLLSALEWPIAKGIFEGPELVGLIEELDDLAAFEVIAGDLDPLHSVAWLVADFCSLMIESLGSKDIDTPLYISTISAAETLVKLGVSSPDLLASSRDLKNAVFIGTPKRSAAPAM